MAEKCSIILYFHNSSANHGCEAIVRATAQILRGYDLQLFSKYPKEDRKYGLDRVVNISCEGEPIRKYGLYRFVSGCFLRILKNADPKCARVYKNIWNFRKPAIALSIGGDNYCYAQYRYPLLLEALNRRLNRNGVKTVLWGCSIEPELLNNKRIVNDLKRYLLITARESITYNALIKAGISHNTRLYPDPAFLLEQAELPLPQGFSERNTVGINISPMIMEYEKYAGMTYKNYEKLIQSIIDTTAMQIALIPHVMEDLTVLERLYSEFCNTGRVVLIQDCNCMELKGYIARCRIFVGARTHAVIAAYSSCVPTLTVGYSVKAKGIAKDIFGTDENYVLPVQALKQPEDLTRAFQWLKNNEDAVRGRLCEFMPDYRAGALKAANDVKNLICKDGNTH
jgi:polysaccharide pyruvyl transferase WcaK-like protein